MLTLDCAVVYRTDISAICSGALQGTVTGAHAQAPPHGEVAGEEVAAGEVAGEEAAGEVGPAAAATRRLRIGL